MSTPFFSIIIPVYNIAPYLRECLDSILGQTFTDWEAICINDGSSDDSGNILNEYALKDKRFRVIHKENGGVSSARNTGLDVATGEWIAFLDGDDVWGARTLDIAARAICANEGADLIRFDAANFYDGEKYPWNEVESSTCEVDVEDISNSICAECVTSFFWEKIYNRRLVEHIRFAPYTIGEDLLFLTQCMMIAKMQIHVKIVCYGYRQRIGSVMHSGVSERKQRDCLHYVMKILDEYDASDKMIDRSLWRSYANEITEQFSVAQMDLPKETRNGLWNEWLSSLKSILRLKKLPHFQRIRINLISLFPFRCVIYLLCDIPYKLKKQGLHR